MSVVTPNWGSSSYQNQYLWLWVPAQGRDDQQRVTQSLRSELDVGRGGADVGVDLGLELGEVLLEHGDKRPRRLVELGLVLPGVDGIEDLGRHPRQRGRNRKAEISVGAELNVAQAAVERGGQ